MAAEPSPTFFLPLICQLSPRPVPALLASPTPLHQTVLTRFVSAPTKQTETLQVSSQNQTKAITAAAGRTLWLQMLPAPMEPTTILPAIPVPCLLYGTEPAVSSAMADAVPDLPATTARPIRQAVQYSLRPPLSRLMTHLLMLASQRNSDGTPLTPHPAQALASPPAGLQ